ncbi:MAG: hypothetical protein ACYS0D_13120 [Planctomycetota bacterium]
MRKLLIGSAGIPVALSLFIYVPMSGAHPTWTMNEDVDTNCGQCHGDFRDSNYISNSDGMNWGNLHDLHRFTMMNGDCSTCHGAGFYPVSTHISDGGAGLEPISCVGCHGRNEDMGNDSISPGRGAGLRQHHTVSGVTLCMDCHLDADPAAYTPVGENVLPSYYFTPDAAHPDKPTDPCSPNGEEDYAGIEEGLNNDGDVAYDGNDPDCGPPCPWDCADPPDGNVATADLLQLLADWNGPSPCDFDGSGTVTTADLLKLLGEWGPC